MKNLESAELLLSDLCDRGVLAVRAHLRLAVVRSQLRKFDESIQQLAIAANIGLRPDFSNALDWPQLQLVRTARPKEFAELVQRAQAETVAPTSSNATAPAAPTGVPMEGVS